eukprot:CAMPEP_0119279246 /NCGR_PEP_ID=MMETSP1329-20130426/20450_1 /TAXON_ID=114041 /ORGANISM="Genus nov. species nov., Strain RCC1024" /LENGTH=471 /DNA_ID=CAMNT_0007279783 /DNA_START=236 /DNA_END=1648 /DNA_ORIENTATION=-
MLAARVPTAISRQDLSKLDSPHKAPRRARSESEHWADLFWDREVIAYALVSFCYALGQALYDIFQSQQAKRSANSLLEWWAGVLPASTIDVADESYLAAYAYAMLVSAYPFAKAISSPYVGDLSDRFGRRPVLVATLFFTAFALFFCGKATTFSGVLACRLLTGCAANGGLLTARATDMAATHMQRTRLFGLFTTSWAVARVVAATLVRALKLDVGRACAMALLCELAAAVLAAAAFSDATEAQRQARAQRRERRSRSPRPAASLSDSEHGAKGRVSFRSLARSVLSERLAYSLFVTAMLTPRVDAARFVQKRFGEGPEAVGVLKALEAVAVVAVSFTPASRHLERAFGSSGAAVVAAVCVAFGWLGISMAPGMPVLYVVVFLRAGCAALYDPAARSLCFQRAKRANTRKGGPKTGSLMGLQQSLKGATQVFGSWLGAYVTSLSVALPLFVSAAASLANAAVIAVECVDDV